MKNKYFVFCITIFFIWSCTYLKVIKKYSDIHLSSKDSSITKLIRTDGFYTSDRKIIGDSILYDNYNLLMRNDGTCATFRNYPLRIVNEPVNLDSAIIKYGKHSKWAIPEMGVYKISHDTLFVNLYNKGDLFNMSWSLIKDRYKILDNETLLWIYRSDPLIHPNEESYNIIPRKFKFVPSVNIPRLPNDFLLKEKWIWKAD